MTDLSKIDTTICLGSIEIHQPVTALTGLMISALCLYFYIQLKSLSTTRENTFYWQLFFMNLCLATVIGACSHAFFQVHEGFRYKAFWLSSQVLDGLCIYAAQQATLKSILIDSKNTSLWEKKYNIQLLLYLVAVFVFQNFLVAVMGFALGLIPVMILHFKNSKDETANLWIACGILISFLTAFIHLSKFALHAYFNHLDAAHVLIMVNVSVMYVGIKQKAYTSSVLA